MAGDPELNQAEGQQYRQQSTVRETTARNTVSPNMAILLGILFIAILFRFHNITLPLVDAFSWRETSTAMMADNFQQRSWNIFFPEVSWTGPGPSYQGREFQIVSYLTAILYQLFGWHDWFGRMIAALFGLVTVFSLHRLTALCWGETHAHAAALAYALMPAAIMIDSSFLPDPSMLALVTLGVWLFTKYWTGGSAWLLPFATASFSLGVLAKPPGLAAGGVIFYLMVCWLLQNRRKHAAKVFISGLVSLFVIGAYYSWAIYLGRTYPPFHVAGSGYIWDSGFWTFFSNDFYFKSVWNTSVWWFYGYPFMILMAVGFWIPPQPVAESKERALSAIPFIWLAAASVVYLAAAREITTNPWNYHIFHVPFAMFCGRGAVVLATLGAKTVPSPGIILRSICIVAAMLVWSTFPLVRTMKAPFAMNGKLLGDELARRAQPGDLVVAIAPEVGDPVAVYYSRARGWVFPPGGGDVEWSRFVEDDAIAIAQLEELRTQGADWFGVAKDAEDSQKRPFIEHHDGVIDYLNKIGTKRLDSDNLLIYEISRP
ncbi:glycosyl transferase [Mesorhizobium sp. M7A.F.Ca.US.014.04.1.1]|uniref:Glycosyl transferase family 39 n=1 Tax=Mesorhizobium ciceri biovar biserrulae (strain HAMBI 2942 / LMG 23838 / WSM1271) TaxID=765698 RepID=E8TKM0_MESCW|nr:MULTISPECIES: glycosyltransferase family 39 protein [Mesorhizobium]ADV13840.1 glycosyl transferase family 39 [Mesorhizobium ciceri biovar biserrulae WSM1271]AMX92235.1 glycosyl transferase [Mesorhizobium ciceri]MDF3210266.1 glycosyltransferase family 39 protein [Mesorhizobium sp. LMG15046]MDF3231295.1 glycosyltransferase family 39 protein [Mesorhizobium sp. DSM 30133]RUU20668.1 glycosyl transferase [Mesorhizobium sp. Primo-B]